ncbi:hypothetical protein KMP13_14355 [Epibacterium ulvae]|uniref:hypothetical protein n=1 Tax=Epibacterium ulvae TaxID=1156985 RepID=UPI001BFC9A9B|nr:hypothetical protein [Epibacterium ulvae]MBT8155037.1 hypothetical protein [Epibacterium ulvae]
MKIIVHDSALGAAATMQATRDFVERQRVPLILTLGGTSFAAVLPYVMQQRMLVATLQPTDLSPDTSL